MAGVEIREATKIYYIKGNPVYALSDINLSIADGSFVTVVGKSGCGKSTLLRLICGLEPLTSGTIAFTVDGCMKSRSEQRISMVFQEPRLMPWLTVEQNMAMALIHEPDKQKVKAIVDHFLSLLGLKRFKDAYPRQISGGMAQRTAVGRTLCYDPDLILMDEPLGALDAFTRRNLQKEMVDLFLHQRKTIVFVTHDVDEAVFLGQKTVVLEAGRVIREVAIPLDYPRVITDQAFFLLREDIMNTIMSD
ncbi:MAG: transporter [Firmicutes bacterium]|nr:transporter [Bacillota bacterium]